MFLFVANSIHFQPFGLISNSLSNTKNLLFQRGSKLFRVLASLKDETAKFGKEILVPQATFVLSPKYYSENVEISAGLELLHK